MTQVSCIKVYGRRYLRLMGFCRSATGSSMPGVDRHRFLLDRQKLSGACAILPLEDRAATPSDIFVTIQVQ